LQREFTGLDCQKAVQVGNSKQIMIETPKGESSMGSARILQQTVFDTKQEQDDEAKTDIQKKEGKKKFEEEEMRG